MNWYFIVKHLIWKQTDSNNIEKYIKKNNFLNFKKNIKNIKNFNFNKYITIHVRDTGFYGEKDRTTRNADINTYINL